MAEKTWAQKSREVSFGEKVGMCFEWLAAALIAGIAFGLVIGILLFIVVVFILGLA